MSLFCAYLISAVLLASSFVTQLFVPHVVSKIMEFLPEQWLVIVGKVFAIRMAMAYMVTDRIFGRNLYAV